MTPEQQKRVEEIRKKVVSTLSDGIVLRGYEADCALLVYIIDQLTAENEELKGKITKAQMRCLELSDSPSDHEAGAALDILDILNQREDGKE